MLRVSPFSGLRFSLAHVPDIGRVLCPPYDVISAEDERHYRSLADRNAVRVELAGPPDDGSDGRYARAAATLRQWRTDGTLFRDHPPAMYLHEARFTLGTREHVRRAIIAAVGLQPWDHGSVLAHERTRRRPKADRLNLLEATATNTSPILSFFERDRDAAVRAADPINKAWMWAGQHAPVAEGADLAGVSQRLWTLCESGLVADISCYFETRPIYIADGHHRYETALLYRERRRAAEGLPAGHPANAVMMHLVASDDHGLVVMPTHRLLRPLDGLDLAQVARRLAGELAVEDFSVDPARPEEATSAVLDRLAALGADRPAVAVYGPDRATVLLAVPHHADAVPSTVPPDRHPSWRTLSTVLADALVLGPLLDAQTAPVEDAVAYTHDAREALASVRSGASTLAVLLDPTRIEQIAAVARAGERMPAKSTYFYPKAPTGLVFRPLD